jgi:hypothetical protein
MMVSELREETNKKDDKTSQQNRSFDLIKPKLALIWKSWIVDY